MIIISSQDHNHEVDDDEELLNLIIMHDYDVNDNDNYEVNDCEDHT